MMNIHELVNQLRQPGARIGVGLWLLPQEYLGREGDLAQKLNLCPIDVRQSYLEYLPAGAKFSGLTRPDGHQKLLDVLRRLANGTHARDCLLIHTLDLLLIGLDVAARERFWISSLDGLAYPRTKLVLTLPDKATYLFPLNFISRYQGFIADGFL